MPAATGLRVFVVGLLFWLALPLSAQAQTPADATLFGSAGPAFGRGGSGWCSMEPGTTLFKRDVAGLRISLPQMTYANVSVSPPQYWTLDGRALLVFSSATAGTLYYNFTDHYPAGVGKPAFSNYSEVYSPAGNSVHVRFILLFPQCSFQVTLIYVTD
jgi:hypothetical protein